MVMFHSYVSLPEGSMVPEQRTNDQPTLIYPMFNRFQELITRITPDDYGKYRAKYPEMDRRKPRIPVSS